MKRFAQLLTRHPLWVLAAAALATLLALHGIVDLRTGAPRLRIDPAAERLLPEGDEDRRFYDRARQLFGNDEFVLLMVEADDVFTTDVLDRVARITAKVAAVPGVRRVVSLASAVDVRGVDGDVVVAPLVEAPPTAPDALAALRARVLAHPLYGGSLVSADGGATALLVSFEPAAAARLVEDGTVDRVVAAAREEAGPVRLRVAGTPYLKVELSRTVLAELRFVLPAILAIATLLSVLAFRTLRGALLPIAAIAIALVWTLGAMGYAGSPLNLVSNIVPPLVITLGFAAAIHVVAEYYERLHHHPAPDREAHGDAIRHVIEEMGVAVLVNGLTTALGFASLAVSTVVAIRTFGLWSVVGVVATTATALVVIPSALAVLGPTRRLPREPGEGPIDRAASALAHFDVRHRRAILVGALVLLVVAGLGMTRIRVSTQYIGDFPPDAPLRQDYEAVNARLGGANAFFVVIEADEDGAFHEPGNLAELRALQDWLEAQPEIGNTASLADGVMLLNQAFRGGDPAAHALPERAGLVKQLLLVGGDDVTQGFVDGRRRVANVSARATVSDSDAVGALLQRIDARLAELPRRLSGRVTGQGVLLNRTLDSIAVNELYSLSIALLTIYLTLAAMLTSFRIGLIALLPNLLPIAIYYGTLGIVGIPLGLSTSLIGSIALGIAVDDTVHYFARFNLEARRLGNEVLATASTLRSVIRPVTLTTVGLVLGFGILTTSDLRSQVQFGGLAAFTLAVAWALDLVLSPALCSSIRLVTLWDLLSLDLGPEPHRAVPMLSGLSARQARIFALMADLVEVPAATRLLTEGETGRDMYVVLSGELVATTKRDGQPLELSRMRRGDVVGEVGLFGAARSADVDVATDARLLRFDAGDLDRLGRRYPKIAAKVYRNLNEVLAERVLNTSRTLRA